MSSRIKQKVAVKTVVNVAVSNAITSKLSCSKQSQINLKNTRQSLSILLFNVKKIMLLLKM